MKRTKIIISLALSIIIVLSCCACSKNGDAVDSQIYEKISANISKVDSGIVEENDNYQLIWDEDNTCIKLFEKNSGVTWSTTPLNDDGSYVEDKNDLFSPIDIEYIKRSAYRTIKITGKIGAVKEGKVSAEKIKDGIKLTFMFDALFIAIPVNFVIDTNGLNVYVDLKDVIEKPNNDSRIYTISLLPYFSSVKNSKENYLFVPSGSGAIMYADERGEGIGREFSAKIYGEDPVQEKNEQYTNDNEIRLSVFGANKSGSSLCGIVSDSPEKCSLSAKAGDKVVGYSNIYPTFQLRGYNGTILDYGGATGKKLVNYYTDEKISSGVLGVSYKVSSDKQSDYNFMANTYRDYLENKYTLQKHSENMSLSLKVYGGLETKEHFFGFPYQTVKPLTTFDDLLSIVKELNTYTDSLDMQLIGFGESGINYGKLAGNFEINDKMGSSKDFSALKEYCFKNNIDIYFDYETLYFNKSGKGFSPSNDNSHTANGYPAEIFKYSPSTNDKMEENGVISILSRLRLDETVDRVVSSAKKYGLKAVSLSSLSNTAYSDFSDDKYQNCSLIDKQIFNYLSTIKNNGFKIAVVDANEYAAILANKIYDVPSNSTLSDAFDCEIPFYQIVFKGYVPFSQASVNTVSNAKKQILKNIEMGTPIQFSIIANYSTDYTFYNHDNLQLMLYKNNVQDIKYILLNYTSYFDKVKNLTIREHTLINNYVRKTVFEDGTTVYVNYGFEEYNIDGILVNASSYKVV